MKPVTLLLILVFGIGYTDAVSADAVDTPPWQPAGKYVHPHIRESSGIAASQQFENVYWTLNDSGNPPTIYATHLNGELIQAVTVRGTRNSDWEALAIDKQNRLWIGDIGNNSRMRWDLKVIVIAEPNPFTETEAEIIASYPYQYPGDSVDAEGLFIADGIPYIVSKEQRQAVLYRFPELRPDTKQVLVRVGELEGAKLVTGAGSSTDRTRLAVCSYNTLWVYHAGTAENVAQLIRRTPWVLPHDFRGEAVCFDGYNLVLTNEARDIYRLPQFWYEKTWTLPPKSTQSAVTLLPKTKAENAVLGVETYRAAGFDMGGSHIVLTSEHAAEPAVLTTTIDVPHRNVYKISTILTRGPEYARVELAANGIAVGSPYDCYSPERIAGTLVTFGTARLNAGENYITLKSVRKTHPETDPKIGIDSYQLLHGSPFVQKYLVLGPFPKTDFRTIDTPYPPETDRDRNATYTAVDGNPIRWREATAATDGMLNLRKHISPNANVVGYALTYVHAPQAMDTALLLGSDEAVAVWLNGNEIHRRNLFRPATPDADTVPCRLQTGWNEVLCKVGQNGWQWTLYLRFTDADGVLNYATHPAE